MPWLVFAFTMGHLTVNHVYRTLYEISPDVIEITGSQMVLVMKLSSFAWNVYDGRRDINVGPLRPSLNWLRLWAVLLLDRAS